MNYELIAQWSQIVSAILFMAALVWIWIRFLQPAVLAAQKAQNARIAEAERHRDEAKAALDGLRLAIEQAQLEADLIKERVGSQSVAERDAALVEAREAGERAMQQAREELPRARAAAREQLRDELVEQALHRARQDALRRVDAHIDRQLVGEFVGSLEKR